jgi:hypothetical protein
MLLSPRLMVIRMSHGSTCEATHKVTIRQQHVLPLLGSGAPRARFVIMLG